MFIDYVKITLKAGNGGSGSTHFLRDEHHIAGGPDGGNGGRGGNIYFIADKGQTNLVDFYYKRKFNAENGSSGGGNNCSGKQGDDLIIKVPKGTVVKEEASGKVIADILDTEKPKLILRGGKGGRGNAFFASSVRQAPNFSELGEETIEFKLILELKTLADVGLIGKPNAGKSTILSCISNANPKIANYPFTTINPNLGVVKYYDKSIVVADIPGLIEGASKGLGLGYHFLRHIERTRILVHVIDVLPDDGSDPYDNFLKINNELKEYDKELANKTQIIALNKCDLVEYDREILKDLESKFDKKYKIVEISSALHKGIDELLKVIFDTLKDIPIPEPIPSDEAFAIDERDTETIKITRDDSGAFVVSGGKIDDLIRGIVLTDNQSFAYFQKRLRNDGIIQMLKDNGAKNGDTIKIKDFEFEMVD